MRFAQYRCKRPWFGHGPTCQDFHLEHVTEHVSGPIRACNMTGDTLTSCCWVGCSDSGGVRRYNVHGSTVVICGHFVAWSESCQFLLC